MSTMQQTILVFKTNIKYKKDIAKVSSVLRHDAINNWNIDRTDIDCVLRIVTHSLSTNDIIQLITNEGYHCSELNN
ncbi:MAG: hypothetical protein V4556_01060 [Bacteroidota bacterium]